MTNAAPAQDGREKKKLTSKRFSDSEVVKRSGYERAPIPSTSAQTFMRHHHSFSHSSHHYQHLLQSQRQQRRILDESFTALRRGAPFLKCGRQGRPHYIYLRLAQVHVGPAMVWHSERRNKARYIPISAVHEILVGRKTNTFRRSMSSTLVSSSPTSLAFSVLYTDKMSRNGAAGVQRSLDLIASNAHELNLWVTGLLALVDGITPPTHVDSPVRKTHAHDDMFQIGFDDSGIGGGESTVSSVSTGNTSDTVNNTRSVRLGANSAALPALEEEEDNDEDCVSSRTYIDDIQAAHLASDSTRHPAYGVSVTDVNVDVNGGTHRPSWNMSHEPGGAASSKPLTQGSDVGTSSASKQVLGDMLVFGRHAKRSSAMPCPLEGSKGLDVRFSSIGADTGIIVCRGGEMYTWGGVPATAASASTAQFNSTISSANAMLGRGHCIESRMPAVVEVRNDICETLLGMKSKSERIEQVSSGKAHCAAVSSSGTLYTWGSDEAVCGVLGFGACESDTATKALERTWSNNRHTESTSQWTPRVVPIVDCVGRGIPVLKQVVYVDCGKFSTAAVTSDGSLFTWGSGAMGVLGHGSRSDQATPRRVAAFGTKMKILRVSMGIWHAAAIVFETSSSIPSVNTDGSISNSSTVPGCCLYTWGDNSQGALGVTVSKEDDHIDHEGVQAGVVAFSLLPLRVTGPTESVSFSSICCGSGHTAALSHRGEVWTWGTGDGVGGHVPALVCIPDKAGASFVTCGDRHTAAIGRRTKKLYTWGRNHHGCLGHAAITPNGGGGSVEHGAVGRPVKEGDVVSIPRLVHCLRDHDTLNVCCGEDTTAVVVNNYNTSARSLTWMRQKGRAKSTTAGLGGYGNNTTFSLDEAALNGFALNAGEEPYGGTTGGDVGPRDRRSSSAQVGKSVDSGYHGASTGGSGSFDGSNGTSSSGAALVPANSMQGLSFGQRLYRTWRQRVQRRRDRRNSTSASGPSARGKAGGGHDEMRSSNMKHILGLRLPSMRRDSSSGYESGGGSEVKAELMTKLKKEQENNERLQREIDALKSSLAMKGDSSLPSPPPYRSKSGGSNDTSVDHSDFEEAGGAADKAIEIAGAGDTRKQWVQEIYKGVFVTLVRGEPSSNTIESSKDRIIKMRFSKEHFDVDEAKAWWKRNKMAIVQRWNVYTGDE